MNMRAIMMMALMVANTVAADEVGRVLAGQMASQAGA